MQNGLWYLVIGWIVGFICFTGIWIYAFNTWGFLIGLAIGWLPALIGGLIAGFLWPLILVAIVVIAFLLYYQF